MNNIGNFDRKCRITVGLVLISMVFVGPEMPWGWFGLLPLATGFFCFCPLYVLLGISTSATCEHDQQISERVKPRYISPGRQDQDKQPATPPRYGDFARKPPDQYPGFSSQAQK